MTIQNAENKLDIFVSQFNWASFLFSCGPCLVVPHKWVKLNLRNTLIVIVNLGNVEFQIWAYSGVESCFVCKVSWRCHQMETFPALLVLCEENPLTKSSEAEAWEFLWSAPEQTVEQTIETPLIWDAIALIMTLLYCNNNDNLWPWMMHSNDAQLTWSLAITQPMDWTKTQHIF